MKGENLAIATEGETRREALILQHLSQVRIVAMRVRDRLPNHIGLEDLISAGVLGLISAVDHFDALHNVKLSTYAEYKIRGAILDALRETDWAPRRHRQRARRMESAISVLRQTLQREPVEDEIATLLGITLEEFRCWAPYLSGLQFISLDSATRLLPSVGPPENERRRELQHAIASEIERMPEIERLVLQMSYYEGLTQREIGKVLDLHESRISQLRTQALQRLRVHLELTQGTTAAESAVYDRASRRPKTGAPAYSGPLTLASSTARHGKTN